MGGGNLEHSPGEQNDRNLHELALLAKLTQNGRSARYDVNVRRKRDIFYTSPQHGQKFIAPESEAKCKQKEPNYVGTTERPVGSLAK